MENYTEFSKNELINIVESLEKTIEMKDEIIATQNNRILAQEKNIEKLIKAA
jgi:hypothetical protein